MIGVSLERPLPLPSKRSFLPFAKFGLVGSITAVIYFMLMWGSDLLFDLPYILAVSLAYFGSTLFHFLANRHFTFSAIDGYPSVQMFRYLIMWCIIYLITILVVGLCFELFHLSPYMGVCVSVLLTMCVGYFLSRYWVFESKGEVV